MLHSLPPTINFSQSFLNKIIIAKILSIIFLSPIISFAQIVDYFPPNQWIPAPDLFYPRTAHTASLLEDGRILILGYSNNQEEIYDPVTNSLSLISSTIYLHSQGFTATLLNNGKVLIVGGINAQQQAELFNPQTNSFETTGNLNSVHSYHSATLLLDGRVLIAGGQNNVGPQTHSICEIFDPLTGIFTLTDTLNNHRSGHKAILLPNGKVLIAGGIQTTTPGSGIYLKSCEIFDPATETFINTQDLNQPRASHEITLLKDGKVLVTGGAYYQSAGEIFDPQTETWALTGHMTVQRRSSHTATLIYNGKVLLAGGNISYITAKAEFYDPSTNSFAEIDSMITPRQQHTATLLQDGSVFVTGGYSTSSVIKHTEKYLIDTNVVGIGEIQSEDLFLANQFILFQNFPNPFNPFTRIQYQVSSNSRVSLKVYDVLGNEIATLADEYKPAGRYEVEFNASLLSSGVYFYQLRTGAYVDTKKMILLR